MIKRRTLSKIFGGKFWWYVSYSTRCHVNNVSGRTHVCTHGRTGQKQCVYGHIYVGRRHKNAWAALPSDFDGTSLLWWVQCSWLTKTACCLLIEEYSTHSVNASLANTHTHSVMNITHLVIRYSQCECVTSKHIHTQWWI